MRQKDADGNVVLVLTPAEAASIPQIMYAAGMAYGYSIARITDRDVAVMNDLLSGAFQVSDEQLIDGLMAAHVDHENDDQVGLLDEFTDMIVKGRSLLVEAGLAEPA